MDRTPTSPLSGLRVLVAEDELLISQFVGEILLHLGCTVVGPVRDLGEALHAIRSRVIDGALLDIRLGEESGYEAASELALRHIPFILMTGQRSLDEAPSLCANAPLLTKPFKVRQLEDMMSSSFGPRDRGGPDRP